MNVVKTYENENLKLEIIQDPCPDSPREDDNLGTMVCWHSRYSLGDGQPSMDVWDWSRSLVDMDDDTESSVVWDEIHKRYIILSLYLYEHSGITMRTKPFRCQWDSGQVGWIYCEKGKEDMTDEQLTTYLEGEVETYDQYLRGDVYGYKCYRLVQCLSCKHTEEVEEDSCWGFYGDDPKENGMSDNLPEENAKLIEEEEE